MTTAERAAAPLLPDLPLAGPTRRGSSRSRIADRVASILDRQRLDRNRHPAARRRRARCPSRNWSATSPGSAASAGACRRPTSDTRRASSKPCAPPSIRRARRRGALHRRLLDGHRSRVTNVIATRFVAAPALAAANLAPSPRAIGTTGLQAHPDLCIPPGQGLEQQRGIRTDRPPPLDDGVETLEGSAQLPARARPPT